MIDTRKKKTLNSFKSFGRISISANGSNAERNAHRIVGQWFFFELNLNIT